jgi:hypothetical protein
LDHTFTAGDLFHISWDTALPLGTFAIAYGCEGGYKNNDPVGQTVSCAGGSGKTYATPFTHAGMVTPEPATIALVGTAFAAIGWRFLRRQRL